MIVLLLLINVNTFLNNMKAINFEKEFEACTHLLKGFAFNLTNDPVDADDLFQDTAYLAFRNKDRFT